MTVSTFASVDNLIIGDDVEKLGTLFANSKLMEDYNYTIPETVKAITNDIFPVYNQYYSEDLIVPETVEVFGAYVAPAYGYYIYSNLFDSEPYISVIENKCTLSENTVIYGYYGTEAYNYSVEHNLTFNPLDSEITGYYGTKEHNYALSNNIKFSLLDDLVYGDANDDGKVSIADMVSLSQHILNGRDVSWGADLTKDGRIDSFDMVFMREMIFNK